MARVESTGVRGVGASGWLKCVLRAAACVALAMLLADAPAATARLDTASGYRPEITVLSLPVTYASMKNKDIDVFLGNRMPSQEGDRKSYVADGSVQVIRANLTGAKYTLAVPAFQRGQRRA